ncbi:MAG: purine-nucleoside phosphorylase [Actinobacteria bacterium]|nr:purine-nucleoside phosphorylase [Actinomycetota bacterium]
MTPAGDGLAARLGDRRPRVLVTLGSGLGALADDVADPTVVPFADAGLPAAGVPGHEGRFVAGRLHGAGVLVQQGRLHLYEGVGAAAVTACVRAAAAVGVDTFVVTNAAGGLRSTLRPGDLLCLTDHLNLTGHNPLAGLWPPPFVDMADAYDPGLRGQAHEAAARAGERLVDGVYAGVLGPAFETPAEVRMLRAMGADAVGMSTVAEVVAARAAGMRVLGLSLVTNVHRGTGAPTAHDEVLRVGREAGPRLAAVLRALLPRLA